MNKYKNLIKQELISYYDVDPLLTTNIMEQCQAIINAGFVENASPLYVAGLIVRITNKDVS